MDIWRQANVNKRNYIFYSYQHNTYSRIDAILATERLSVKLVYPAIGIWALSDHAPVTVKWQKVLRIARPHSWWLNNYLLESPGLRGQVESSNSTFYSMNELTTTMGMLWDSFKAYIRGVFIPFKARRDKMQNPARNELVTDIHKLKDLNKNQVTAEHTDQLRAEYGNLQIMDARVIAQEMLYAKQRVFEYYPC